MANTHAPADARFTGLISRDGAGKAVRHRHRRSWTVERLEGRELLSIYLVDRTGDVGAGSGIRGDIRYAFDHANQATGDSTIVFAPNVFVQGITLSQGMLVVNKPSGTLTIRGPGASLLPISGGQLSPVLDVAPGSQAIVSGLTITGGVWGQGPGGGIINDGQLTLEGDTVTGNSAFAGGGGIANNPSATMVIQDSTVSGNVAMGSDGGGIANGGTMTIVRSTISGNGSRGGYGGGIVNVGTMSIGNSTISGNKALTYQGGGIFNVGALTLNNDTVSNNSANINGGGIVNQVLQNSSMTMNNTIVAENSDTVYQNTRDLLDNVDPSGRGLVGTHNLIGSGDLGSLTGTLVGVNPLLGPLQNNGGPTASQAIQIGSPAAGGGDTTVVPAAFYTDQRGGMYSRVVNGRIDIGAFEIQPPPLIGGPLPVERPIGVVFGTTGSTTSPVRRPKGRFGSSVVHIG